MFVKLLLFVFYLTQSDAIAIEKHPRKYDQQDFINRFQQLSKGKVECFKTAAKVYYLLLEKANWYEANEICRSGHGLLAIVYNEETVKTIASFTQQSNLQVNELWIGGHQTTSGIWSWSDDSSLDSEPTNGYPPWTRYPQRTNKKCLLLHTRQTDKPIFVDLNCLLIKPFMCERDFHIIEDPKKLPPNSVAVNKLIYSIFHQRVMWQEAAAFCISHGQRLAIVDDNKTAKAIVRKMLEARPSINNAWIGAHKWRDQWKWLSTYEEIHLNSNSSFSMWAINEYIAQEKCGVIDRHLLMYHLMPKKCSSKLPFICEDGPLKIPIPIGDNKRLSTICGLHHVNLIFEKKNWREANDYCQMDGGGFLMEIKDQIYADCVFLLMKTEELHHLWLGGKYEETCNRWQWQFSYENISMDNSLIVPWCETERHKYHDCLNLDFNWLTNKPEAYSLNCYVKQPFLCMYPNQEDVDNRKQKCI